MPIDIEKLFTEALAEVEAEIASGKRPRAEGGGKWAQLWEVHPEGGGPFNGRDNALTAFVGFMRAKSIPFEIAKDFAYWWSSTFCQPPLERSVIDEKMSRKWVEWAEGGLEDDKPEDFVQGKKEKKERQILMASDLLDMDPDISGLWLVPNVLVKQGIHYISAPAAGGKSWVMLDLARAMTCNTYWIGKLTVPQGNVLYIDEEMGKLMTSDRIRRMGFTRDAPFYYLGKEGINLQLAEDCKYIQQVCIDKKIDLVIIDTLTGVRPGLKENESEHVSHLRAVFNQIVATGATLLVAHHDRKGRADEDAPQHEKMRGSGDFAAMADMVYGISKQGDTRTIKATKNRMCAEEDAMNVEFELRVEDGKIALYPLTAEEKGRKRFDAMSQRILDVLADGKQLSQAALAETVGGRKEVVIAAAEKLTADGELEIQNGPRGAKLYSLSRF